MQKKKKKKNIGKKHKGRLTLFSAFKEGYS